VFVDDIEVDALGGAPGCTRRAMPSGCYGSGRTTGWCGADARRTGSRARFVAVVALARGVSDTYVRGEVEGLLLDEPVAEAGLGMIASFSSAIRVHVWEWS